MDNLSAENKRYLNAKITPLDSFNQSRQNEGQEVRNSNRQNSKTNPNTCDGNLRSEYEKIKSIDNHIKRNLLKGRGNFIMRQELKSYTPECSALCGIISNLIIALCCLSVGVPSVIYSNKALAYSVEYTTCYLNRAASDDVQCSLSLNVMEDIKSPVLVYYELSNFFLNHRQLVKSKLWAQLRGEDIATKDSNCNDAWTMEEMFGNNSRMYTNQWGHTFSSSDPANPCGLFPRSYFNDTFALFNSDNSNIFINETNISNKYLHEKFYKRNAQYATKQWVDVENEHFINWMNVETFNHFRKLWGRIDHDLPKGVYTVLVQDNYNVSMYDAKKSFVLTSSNMLGENNFLGWALIAVASYSFLVIIILWVLILSNRDKMFEINYLKWK